MALADSNKSTNHRSRAAQKIFRKQQLIDATIDCINRLGISQTTLAKITEKAGVSQGIVIFHFRSKEALFEQALGYLSEEYCQVWQAAYDKAGDAAIDKLCSMVQATFSAVVCNRKKISVWYAFWGEARSRPKYQEICGQTDREFSETLENLCRKLCGSGTAAVTAEVAAHGIEGMIDGLWQNCLLIPESFNRQQACRTVFELMEAIFPDERVTIGRYKNALS